MIMNLFLHGIGSDEGSTSPIRVADSLSSSLGEYFDMVLTNPPFGRKSSVTFVNEKGREEREASVIVRDDFWTSTSNKQLNFVQHVKSLLTINGRAAIVVPDNVLFEGGAGEIIRRKLLQECDVHTLLRLPTGIFYAQGVKANVLYFDRKPASPHHWTEHLWVYDLRTNQDFTLRTNPLTRKHLDDFVARYHAENRHQREEGERFRAFSYDDLLKRDKLSLDLFWLRDESLEGADTLPPPDVLAASIVEDLQAALEQFLAIAEDLGGLKGMESVGGGK
jgi:type I restriction enzyme M protein